MPKFRINSLDELSESEKNFVRETCVLGDPVLDSFIFESKFLAIKNMKGTLGRSNRQIWMGWQRGGDGPGRTPDGFLELNIVGFWDSSRTVGSVPLWGKIQRLNRRILGKMKHEDLFSHFIHEGFHKIGYYHKAFLWGRRDVPYRAGEAALAAFKEFYKDAPKTGLTERPAYSFVAHEKSGLTETNLKNFYIKN